MTELAAIEASWDQAARDDAMFNIITDPSKRDGGWTPEEFFGHGRAEVDAAMLRLEDQHGEVGNYYRALDFGCGVGRTAKALTFWFERVDGVDISKEMIEQARRYTPKHTAFHHHTADNLALFEDDTFDLVYSMVVLQHMPRTFQQRYVREFFRVLRSGGVAMFHVPEGPDSGHPGWHLSMFGTPQGTVQEWITDADAALVDIEDLGQDSGWRNYRYTAVAS